jgi:hypothetical protein
MTETTPALGSPPSAFAGSDWFDPLEEAVRCQMRSFIEQLLEEELEAARRAGGVMSAAPARTAAATGSGRAGWSPRSAR